MSDQGELYDDSWILNHVLDMMMGNHELVTIRRKLALVEEEIWNAGMGYQGTILTGSRAEGAFMKGSDSDRMTIDKRVVVICPHDDSSITPDITNKTVFVMRDANSRPGYVNLELIKRGRICSKFMIQSVVPVGDLHFISSEMYRRSVTESLSDKFKIKMDVNGPANILVNAQSRL